MKLNVETGRAVPQRLSHGQIPLPNDVYVDTQTIEVESRDIPKMITPGSSETISAAYEESSSAVVMSKKKRAKKSRRAVSMEGENLN